MDPNLLSRIFGYDLRNTIPGIPSYPARDIPGIGRGLDVAGRMLIPGAETTAMAQRGDASTAGLLGSLGMDLAPIGAIGGGLLGGARRMFPGIRGMARTPGGWSRFNPLGGQRLSPGLAASRGTPEAALNLEATNPMSFGGRDIMGVREAGSQDIMPFYRSTGRNSDEVARSIRGYYDTPVRTGVPAGATTPAYGSIDLGPTRGEMAGLPSDWSNIMQDISKGGEWMPFGGIQQNPTWFRKPAYAGISQDVATSPFTPSYLKSDSYRGLLGAGVPSRYGNVDEAVMGRYGTMKNYGISQRLGQANLPGTAGQPVGAPASIAQVNRRLGLGPQTTPVRPGIDRTAEGLLKTSSVVSPTIGRTATMPIEDEDAFQRRRVRRQTGPSYAEAGG